MMMAVLGGGREAAAAPGDFDTTFGVNGVRSVTNGTELEYNSVVRAGNRYFASGTTVVSGVRRPILTAFTATGAVDTTFGTSGHKVDTTIVAQAGSSAVSTGSYVTAWPGLHNVTYVFQAVATPTTITVTAWQVEYDGPTSGTQQWKTSQSFTGGVLPLVDMFSSNPGLQSQLPNAVVVVAGGARTSSGGKPQAVLLKLSFNTGALVTSFGSSGVAYVNAGTSADRFTAVVATGANYCAAGRTKSGTSPWNVLVACVDSATGVPSSGFSGDGIATIDFGQSLFPDSLGRAMQWDSANAKLVIAANLCDSSGTCRLGLARLTSAGALDTTFDGDGKSTFNLGGVSSSLGLGKIVTVGSRSYVTGQLYTASDFSTADSFLFAFGANGQGDSTFGSNGLRYFSNAATGLESYAGLTVNADSTRLVIPGSVDTTSGTVNGTLASHLP